MTVSWVSLRQVAPTEDFAGEIVAVAAVGGGGVAGHVVDVVAVVVAVKHYSSPL